MNIQQFLTAHGEKVALGLIGVAVAWWISSTSDDPALIADRGLTIEDVRKDLDLVKQRREVKDQPKIGKPTDYLARMSAVLARPVETEPRMAWLTVPPDIGPRTGNKPFFFVYETRSVAAQASDRIGSVELAFKLPDAGRTNDAQARVYDQASVAPSRDSGVANRVRWLGIQVHTRLGDGQWQPLSGQGIQAEGVIPLSAAAKPLVLRDLDPWTVNSFRARLILAATSYVGTAAPQRTMLIHEGRFAEPMDPLGVLTLRRRVIDPWPDSLDATPTADTRRRDLLRQFQLPLSATSVANLIADRDESLFTGPWGDATEVIVTDRRRFALTRAALDNAGSATASASFDVLLYWDEEKAWDAKPKSYRNVLLGDGIGKGEQVPPPGKPLPRPADYSTGYVLKSTDSVKRVYFYEIVTRNRPNVSRAKDLAVNIKSRQVNAATVMNTINGNTLQMLPLEAIAANIVPEVDLFEPGKGHPKSFRPVYPAIFHYGYNEPEVFKRDPVAFRSFGLSPAEPIKHAPGTGPLAKLGKPEAVTDTDYFELPDGRLVWVYHHAGFKVLTWVPPNLVLPTSAASGPGAEAGFHGATATGAKHP